MNIKMGKANKNKAATNTKIGSWKKKTQDAASRPQMGVLAGTREAPTAIDFINFDSTGQPSV